MIGGSAFGVVIRGEHLWCSSNVLGQGVCCVLGGNHHSGRRY